MKKIKTSVKKGRKLLEGIVYLIDTIGCDDSDAGCVCGVIAAKAAVYEKMTRDNFIGFMGDTYDAEKITYALRYGINKETNETAEREANDHH